MLGGSCNPCCGGGEWICSNECPCFLSDTGTLRFTRLIVSITAQDFTDWPAWPICCPSRHGIISAGVLNGTHTLTHYQSGYRSPGSPIEPQRYLNFTERVDLYRASTYSASPGFRILLDGSGGWLNPNGVPLTDTEYLAPLSAPAPPPTPVQNLRAEVVTNLNTGFWRVFLSMGVPYVTGSVHSPQDTDAQRAAACGYNFAAQNRLVYGSTGRVTIDGVEHSASGTTSGVDAAFLCAAADQSGTILLPRDPYPERYLIYGGTDPCVRFTEVFINSATLAP
jgi:hypothetical protein